MSELSQNDIERVVKDSFGTRITERQFALLGNYATKDIKVADSDQPNLVYVHGVGEDKTSSFPAFNSVGIVEIFGRPVEIELTKLGYKIVGLAPEDAIYMDGVNLSSQTPVFRSQLMFGGIVPQNPPSDTVIITGTTYRIEDVLYVTKDEASGDLLDGSTNDTSASSIDLPSASGQAILVLIQVDPTTGTITYKQSSEFNASYTLYQIGQNGDIPAPDTGNFLCGYVRLIKGITALTWDHVINTPDVLSNFSGGGTSTSSVTATAGENLSERNFVFLDESDDEWYKIDIDATSSVKTGAWIACVTESGGITSSSTGSVQLRGEITGFTGLTPWRRLYASSTAGSYTQTRPNVTDGGAQLAIIDLGYAINTTTIMFDPKPIIYAKRETLANNAELTIEHHSDAQTRIRKVLAYVATSVAGSTLESYSSSNYDSDANLRLSALAGDTYTISHGSGAPGYRIGDNSDTEYMRAQQFQSGNGGELTQFTFRLAGNIGSPTGDLTWRIHADNSDEPGTILESGS